MLDEVCDSIFERCSGPDAVPGRIVWCPVGNVEEVPRVLDVERATPTDHFATKFSIVQMGAGHFKERTRLPVKSLTLQGTEELLIAKAKKRPCVVVSSPNTDFADHETVPEIKRKRHLWNGAVLLAPLYGLETAADGQGFPPVMVARIKALLYSQFIHIPQKCPKSGISMRKDAIVRLDRMFSAVPAARAVEMEDYKLAEEPLALLLAMARVRLGGEPTDALSLVMELAREALPDAAVPPS